MGKLLLVGVTPDEESTLNAAVGSQGCRVVDVADLDTTPDSHG